MATLSFRRAPWLPVRVARSEPVPLVPPLSARAGAHASLPLLLHPKDACPARFPTNEQCCYPATQEQGDCTCIGNSNCCIGGPMQKGMCTSTLRSPPARSTMDRRPQKCSCASPSSSEYVPSSASRFRQMTNTEWEREDCRFRPVAALWRWRLLFLRISMADGASATSTWPCQHPSGSTAGCDRDGEMNRATVGLVDGAASVTAIWQAYCGLQEVPSA